MIATEMQPIQETLPPPGLLVLVQCDGFRCMAYRTTDGRWMSAFSFEELQSVISVLND
jgi:hypothetical protein